VKGPKITDAISYNIAKSKGIIKDYFNHEKPGKLFWENDFCG
jgi:hypothetical protein